MTRYVTPLARRLYISRYTHERYKRDPEFRLRKVNCLRVRLGLEPRASVDDIAPKSGSAR